MNTRSKLTYAPSTPSSKPVTSFTFNPFEYGKLSKSYKQLRADVAAQEAQDKAVRDQAKHLRLLSRFNDRIDRKRLPVCDKNCTGPCCLPDSAMDFEPGYEADSEAESKEAKSAEGPEPEPVSMTERLKRELKEPSAPAEEHYEPGKPTTLVSVACAVCKAKCRIDTNYQSAEHTTCSETCFFVDYNKDPKKYGTIGHLRLFLEIAKEDPLISFTLRYQDAFDQDPYSSLHQNSRHLGELATLRWIVSRTWWLGSCTCPCNDLCVCGI